MCNLNYEIFSILLISFFGFTSSVTVRVYSSHPSRSLHRGIELNSCPLKCRCVSLNHRGSRDLLDRLDSVSSWRGSGSPRQYYPYGRMADPGRSMVCQGLRRLPKPVPSDIVTLTIYGDSSKDTRRPTVSPDQQSDDHPIITHTQLRHIDNDVFSNNYLLSDVTLSGNNLGVLYPYVFSRLGNLKNLVLPNNNIRHLSAAVFRGLQTLEKLKLSDNVIEHLPQFVFNYVPNLKSLNLNGNKIQRLQGNQFKSLIRLQTLDLSRNNITDLYDDTFDRNVRLQELFLNGNRISAIRPRWFHNLHALKTLSFRGNVISQVTTDSFTNLNNLEELLLSANLIETLEEGSFESLKKLKVLDLATNDIHEIQSTSFTGLEALEELYLGSNQLRSIEPGAFSNMNVLNRLDLSRNHIDSLEDGTFSSLSYLKYLDLSHNKLRTIQQSFFSGLRELKELNLDHNFISQIEPSAFSTVSPVYLSKLSSLDLQFNSLRKLEADALSGIPNLKFLNLGNNRLKRIHSLALSSLENLQKLFLNNNKVKKLGRGVFRRLRHLSHFDLSNNKIRVLPNRIFEGLQNVEDLDLASNAIYSISPEAFKHLHGLVELSLTENKLTNFNLSLVDNLPSLVFLDVSDNHLFWITVPKLVNVGLKELLLSQNNLHTIKKDIQTVMKDQAALFISGNPLSCDCHMAWMRDSSVTRKLRIEGTESLLCRSPSNNHGKKLIDLNTDELTCDPKAKSKDETSLICSDVPSSKVVKYNARTGVKALLKKHVTILNQDRVPQFGGVLLHNNWALVPGNAVRNAQQSTIRDELKVKIGRTRGLRRIHHVIRHPLGSKGMEQYNVALLHLEADDKGYPVCLMTVNQFDTFSRIISRSTFTTRMNGKKPMAKLKARYGKIRPKCSNENYLCVKVNGKNGRNRMLLDGSPLYLGLAGDFKLAGIGTGLQDARGSNSLFIPLWTMTDWINKVIEEYDSKCPIKRKNNSACSQINLPTENELLAQSSMLERH